MLELLVPRLSGFDRLGVTENGHVLGGEEHLDAARDAWLAADVAEALQREDHLVHGRRAELERALHVGLSWRKVTVTEHRTARDYAKRLRELVEITLAILLSSGGRCTGETVSRLEAATMAATRAMRPSSHVSLIEEPPKAGTLSKGGDVAVTVLNSQGRAVELGPVVRTLYSVPMSVQQAPRQLLDLDAITEMMEMAEQDVKMRL